MTRYFYTDPLAAAWMWQYHGIRYESSLSAEWQIRVSGHGESSSRFEVTYDYGAKPECFYIHPDSLYLLQPQAGDIVKAIRHEVDYEFAEEYVIGSYSPVGNVTVRVNPGGTLLHTYGEGYRIEIILRNGIPFMAPEKE